MGWSSKRSCSFSTVVASLLPSYLETGAAVRSGGALLPLPTNPWKMIYLCPALTLARSLGTGTEEEAAPSLSARQTPILLRGSNPLFSARAVIRWCV